MSFGLYVLDDRQRPQLMCSRPSDRDGLLAWARWMTRAQEGGALTVALDEVGDAQVSTSFLGVNLNTSASTRPLVFETAIFRGGECRVMQRTAAIDDARAAHASALLTLQAVQRRIEGDRDGN